MGEAFRLNGYRFPENDALLRRDNPVPLGVDEWEDLWPRAIWPGELSSIVPIALRVQNDVQVIRDGDGAYSWSYRFPHEVYLLAGTTLGESIGAFLETEWSREGGIEVLQAKATFQDLLPWLPERSMNLWVGMQNSYLFTFADRQIDRIGRQNFLWQTHRISDLTLRNPQTSDTLVSTNEFQLRQTQPSLEINGLLGGRLYYGMGLAQGIGNQTTDNDDGKDVYYKVRYKLGGLGLDGSYGSGGAPVLGSGGLLLDRSLIVEHFGYWGTQPVDGGQQDNHRSFGVNARALYGRIDLGVGYVWGENDNPWGASAAGVARHSSLFGKLEYLFFPWLTGSLKFDTFDVDVPASVRALGFTEGSLDQSRVLPGVVVLVRQNIRGVVEAEFYAEHEPSADSNSRKPQKLWLRLDMAF